MLSTSFTCALNCLVFSVLFCSLIHDDLIYVYALTTPTIDVIISCIFCSFTTLDLCSMHRRLLFANFLHSRFVYLHLYRACAFSLRLFTITLSTVLSLSLFISFHSLSPYSKCVFLTFFFHCFLPSVRELQ